MQVRGDPVPRPADRQASSDAGERRGAVVLLAMVIVLWGVNWSVIKTGIEYIPPLWFAVIRVVLGGTSLALMLAVQGRLRLPPRVDLPVVLSIGLLQIGGFLALTHLAIQFVPAGRSAILAYTTPLWVTPLAAVVLHETFGVLQIAAVTLGMLGVGALVNPLTLDYADPHALLGNGMLLASALIWALSIVHNRRHRWQARPAELIPWQMAVAGLLLLSAALLFEPAPVVHWDEGALWLILAYNGPIASGLCYWAFITLNRKLSATATALGSLGVPVVGVLASALWLGEALDMATVLGLALIVGAIGLLALPTRRAQR